MTHYHYFRFQLKTAGLTESIVAAAASRIGKTVLHLDPNDFYGGYWASFNLEAIQSLPGSNVNSEELVRRTFACI